MNCFKITFTPKAPIEDETDLRDLLWSYLGCLYKNGQILKDYMLIKTAECYTAFVTLPEDGALDEKYNNVYISDYLEKLRGFVEIGTEAVGKNLDMKNSCCCKEKPDWYMLYTNWAVEEPPVVCGRCGHEVPLYKLPHIFNEKEHNSVLGWMRAYKEIDGLFLYCLSDRFTYRQMNNPDSQLSKAGREICKEFEEATGVPFYYYVFHYQGISGNRKTPELCPSCGKDWKLTGEKAFIDYKCDNCRLVADEVPIVLKAMP